MRPVSCLLVVAATFGALGASTAEKPASIKGPVVEQGNFPSRVHVFEDYETDIEKRWWMRGELEAENVPPSRSRWLPNRRASRATDTRDFDRKMGDQSKTYNAVIFNPVPGPPMDQNTRLSFRYWVKGTDSLRVQIYSLSNNYHRHLVLEDLPQGEWHEATVDMTAARRPDGSGGKLSKDERIDDIQFYVESDAELLIDDIVLYEAAAKGEKRPFPRRVIFTGWFDTGKQGDEWPGKFDIVLHEKAKSWDAARSVVAAEGGRPSIHVGLRGERPAGEVVRVRFLYHLRGGSTIDVGLLHNEKLQTPVVRLPDLEKGKWSEATADFRFRSPDDAEKVEHLIDMIRFEAPEGNELMIDDLLIYEPGGEIEKETSAD